jgi:hypothetical protein
MGAPWPADTMASAVACAALGLGAETCWAEDEAAIGVVWT